MSHSAPGGAAPGPAGVPGTKSGRWSRLPGRDALRPPGIAGSHSERCSGTWSVCGSRADSRGAGEAKGRLKRCVRSGHPDKSSSGSHVLWASQVFLCGVFFLFPLRVRYHFVPKRFVCFQVMEFRIFWRNPQYEVLSEVFENVCKYHPVNGLFLVFLCKKTHVLNCDSVSHIYYFCKLRPSESCITVTGHEG